MTWLKTVTAAAMLTVALSAIAVATASAADEITYTGRGKFTISSPEGTLETNGELQITCTSDTGSGQLAASPARTALLTVVFKGCKTGHKKCSSEPKSPSTEEIDTRLLEATFALNIAGTVGVVELTPDPATGKAFLPEAHCGTVAITVEEALLGEFKELSGTEFKSKFKQTGGMQAIKEAKIETTTIKGSLAVNLGSGVEEAGLTSEETLKLVEGTGKLTI
jgi:hypothetical protein